jgi:hypothetical protein
MKHLLIATICVCVTSLAALAQSMFDKVNDFDGDGRADYAVTRNEGGLKIWHIWRSTAGYAVLQWGLADDTVTAGDFDGDSRTDVAVARLTFSNGLWAPTTYYLASSNGSLGIVDATAININGTRSLWTEDWDGDGKTDPGIFQHQQGGFLAYRASTTGEMRAIIMGWPQVRVGDLNGNNAAEVANYNSSTGEIIVTGTGVTRFGVPGDQWIVADLDGDNIGEIAIFRPSTGDWWWIRSSDSVMSAAHWGLNGDIPVPADYDGDSKSDLAVWRPGSPGVFWVFGSTAGVSAFAFGLPTDSVVTY